MKPEPVTAETITDAQIRELNEYHRGYHEAQIALGTLKRTRIGTPVTEWRKRQARTRCAEVYNARFGGAK